MYTRPEIMLLGGKNPTQRAVHIVSLTVSFNNFLFGANIIMHKYCMRAIAYRFTSLKYTGVSFQVLNSTFSIITVEAEFYLWYKRALDSEYYIST